MMGDLYPFTLCLDPHSHSFIHMLANNSVDCELNRKQLQNSGLLRPPMNQNGGNNHSGPCNNGGNQQNGGSPVGDSKPSTFFNYPVPVEEPRSSPSGGSNNVMMNGGNNLMNGAMNGMMNGLNNQQSNQSFHGMNMMHDDEI